MVEYKFDGVNDVVVLPDEYLTVGQIEEGYRALVKKGEDQLDLTDPASGRILAQALLGEGAPDFAAMLATPENMKELLSLYGHVGDLFSKSMALGDEVIEEVEAKKEETEEKPKSKQKRRRSKSK